MSLARPAQRAASVVLVKLAAAATIELAVAVARFNPLLAVG